ncbi:hypothetical protein [Lelliottia sp. RWM.1]|uniref:hypothetical protein n=1 Tax=Lelliottia sp. RWM.1 TaxID=2663242 RepID=UPI00193E645E|nr:hypothetical protein [Lelliottia sp. RWM.1]MBM3072508.1 hypothetical protein [Lelliottia sp. RWM.1]
MFATRIAKLCLLILSTLAVTQEIATAAETSTRGSEAFLQLAISYDLSGKPELARPIYDQLSRDNNAELSAVPSAVNYIALNNIKLATTLFSAIEHSAHSRDRNYAQLWSLWLTAYQWKGSKTALIKRNKQYINTYTWDLPWEQRIARLYAGEITPEALLLSISNWNVNEKMKSDVLTESLFFANSYLEFVDNNTSLAKELFTQYQHALNNSSLEQPLLLKKYEK